MILARRISLLIPLHLDVVTAKHSLGKRFGQGIDVLLIEVGRGPDPNQSISPA
jgi:hypothetical protein